MPRIRGRRVLAGNLEERRILLGLGVQDIRVPRGVNPYLVARRLRRCAQLSEDQLFLADIAGRKPRPPSPSPEPDTKEVETKPHEGPIDVRGTS